MFYKYDERMSELNRISKISYAGVKGKALKTFIKKEKQILNSLDVPTERSQALDSAIRKLEQLENPRDVINPEVARALFF